ncbi:restriction endonuclease subunit S [Roseiconus lacunae]|uniref:restriction endonuclease subunit S n=1 Tax=Roseiconus lacunae TaxID=2605694 RepID=UPI0011F35D30|nr:restriction endonuclease subunit S [Roseiconus lacunae]
MRLDELGHVSRGRSRHRPRDAEHLYGGPHPFVQTGDIKSAQLYLNRFTQTYSDAGLAQSKKWPVNTLCITIAANIAETAILGIEACFPDSVIGFVADDEVSDVRFIKYKLDVVKQEFQKVSQGAAQANLSQQKLLSIPLSVPPVSVQKDIADRLSAYDDLIENNRRRMELLEASARHLYEEWFVRLRFPGHEHTPIKDGVPKGWVTRPLSDCSTFSSGGTPRKSNAEYWDGDIPWISSGEMTHWRLHDSERRVTSEGSENGTRLVPPGTILAVVRGMSLAKEFRIAMCSRSMTFNQDLKAITANEDVRPLFLYSALIAQREVIRDRSTEASHGTKKLDTAVLSSTPIPVPPMAIQDAYCEYVSPMHELWDRCWSQNTKLKAARDHLLPRLMSGEVPV